MNAAEGARAAPVPQGHPAQVWQKDGIGRHLAIFWDLLFIQLASIRSWWYWFVLSGLVFPLSILAFVLYVGGGQGVADRMYLIAGDATIGLIIGPVQMLASRVGYMRAQHELEYYATLPIQRLALVLAIGAMNALVAVPGLIGVLAAGALFLNLPLSVSPWLVPVCFLASFSLAGFGAAIGVLSKDGNQANAVGNVLMVLLMFFSPVMVRSSALPEVLRWLGYLMPTTYAAAAIRGFIGAGAGTSPWLAVLVLAAYSALLYFLVVTRLDWRRE
jgi:ABC-2 type transport system permease protein